MGPRGRNGPLGANVVGERHALPRSCTTFSGGRAFTFFQGAGIVPLLLNNLTGMPEDSLCIALPRTGIGWPAGLRFHSLAAPRRVG